MSDKALAVGSSHIHLNRNPHLKSRRVKGPNTLWHSAIYSLAFTVPILLFILNNLILRQPCSKTPRS